MKKVIWILIYILMAYSAYSGIWNGYYDWHHSKLFWERFVVVLNFLYGVLAAVALPGLLFKKSWAFATTTIWAILTVACAISAIVVFNEKSDLLPALIGGSLSLLAIFIPLLLFIRKNFPSA